MSDYLDGEPVAGADPYADARLAIEVHETVDREGMEHGNNAWTMLRDRKIPSQKVLIKLVEALPFLVPNMERDGQDKDEVLRQMGLPNFLRWIAGKLGEV